MDREKHAPFALKHSSWPIIGPYLQEGEVVYWVGRPLCRRLWDPLGGSVGAGAIGLSMIVLPLMTFGSDFFHEILADAKPAEAWAVNALLAAFGACCLFGVTAPFRCWWKLRRVAYAVTSRRALVVRGYAWPSQSLPGRRAISEQSFDREQVRTREVLGKQRDIGFRRESRPSLKGNRQIIFHYGFQAVDDFSGAEAAIKQLLIEPRAISPADHE